VEKSRKQATAKNITFSLIYQIITVIMGFIIPQLFLNIYGPKIHGLTSSITNIISYVLLLTAGLNAASIQALYVPLSKKEITRINQVLNAIKQYYYRISLVFFVVISLISFILPIFIKDVPTSTVFLLMLIMGMQSTLDCYLVSKYRILLQADQKLYINVIINILLIFIRGILQIFLIINECSVIIVQTIPTLMIFVLWIFQLIYVRKHYPFLNKKIRPDKSALSKRWAAFIHQIAGLIVNNVDILLLTLLGDMILVSIYSVYQMVFSHINNMMTSVFSQGTVASFGHLMGTDNKISLRKNYNVFELFYFIIVSIVFSITATMMLPFVQIYTSDVKNVNYFDLKLVILFVTIAVANNLRVPGLMLINAGGFYKETLWRALIESALKLISSIILMNYWGIYGILFGSVVSFAYRTVDIIFFSNKYILNQSSARTFYRSLRVIIVILINVFVFNIISPYNISSWPKWIIITTIVGIYSSITTLIVNIVFDFKTLKDIFSFLKIILKINFRRKKI
jgi:O-antigen/teichoic acid export membrane protein